MTLRALFLAAVLCLAACSSQPAGRDVAADREALIALDQAYAEHWKRNDADAVMSLFAGDAVVIPHDGDEPRVGAEAIRAAWFSASPASFAVERFDHRVSDVVVENGRGVLWGTFTLVFTLDRERYSYDGNFLLAGRERSADRWEITHLIWNDPPPTITAIP